MEIVGLRPTVHYHCIIMTQAYRDFSIFKTVGVNHPEFFNLKFLTAVHFIDMFSIIVPTFVEIRDIAVFRIFSSEM